MKCEAIPGRRETQKKIIAGQARINATIKMQWMSGI
jgi:hypothetical protein